jgi:hypothetical protein
MKKALVNLRCMKMGVVKRSGATMGALSQLGTASRYVSVALTSVAGLRCRGGSSVHCHIFDT